MKIASSLGLVFTVAWAASVTSPAHAWDPNEGADTSPRPGSILPRSVVPSRYYAPANYAPAPATYTLAPAPVYTPPPASAAMSPAPVAAAAPIVYAPPPPATGYPAPAYDAYSATPMAQPAPAVQFAPNNPNAAPIADAGTQAPAPRKTQFALGVEGFGDNYKEHSATVDNHATYGAIDGTVTYHFDPKYFGFLDGRVSYGHDHYKSDTGNIDGIPEWETDFRAAAGFDMPFSNNQHVKPYIGVGSRYYLDQFKGYADTVDDITYHGYDRVIFQFYVPIGATYEFNAFGLQFAPNIEYDPIAYGHVQSRTQTLGYNELDNAQHGGYGLRDECGVKQLNDAGMGWQFAPFFRYWNVDQSVPDNLVYHNVIPLGPYGEPHNTRFQAGANLKFLF